MDMVGASSADAPTVLAYPWAPARCRVAEAATGVVGRYLAVQPPGIGITLTFAPIDVSLPTGSS